MGGNLSINGSYKPSDSNANLASHPERERKDSLKTSGDVSAVVEMDMDDTSNVTVDTPQVNNSNIPSLFLETSSSKMKRSGTVKPAYIWVQEEQNNINHMEHEMSLLREYQDKEKHSESKERNSAGSDSYEKSIPSHGDIHLHKMISILQIKKHLSITIHKMCGEKGGWSKIDEFGEETPS